MALFSFRTRNPQRDQDTDDTRVSRLRMLLDDLRLEMEREGTGLRDRYESVTMRAAFSQQALENERGGPELSSEIDGLTETIMRYTQRIASLEKQMVFVTEMLERVDKFSKENQAFRDEPYS